MEKKKILFIAPTHMDIYKDVEAELINQGYEVDFLKAVQFDSDPYSFSGYRRLSKYLVSECYFSRKITKYWHSILNSSQYNKSYDILFVIDGHSVRKVLFDILRARNSKLYAVNYLFDTTTGVYQFEKAFPYYDRIYTFDTKEAKQYRLEYLPIFWTPVESEEKEWLFFGMGGFNYSRFNLFLKMKDLSDRIGRKSFLKLVTPVIPNMKFYRMKFYIRKLLGYSDHISTEIYSSDYVTHQALSPSDFKCMMRKSDITIDTCATHQVGMTARYMWALGNGEKIITTNVNAECEGLSESGQLFVVKDVNSIDKEKLMSFINTPYVQSANQNNRMEQYRIDNWIRTLLAC